MLATTGLTETVEAHGGHLTIEREAEWGDDQVPAFRVSTAPGDYSFYVVLSGGIRDPIEFRDTDDGMTMYWHRYRLDET